MRFKYFFWYILLFYHAEGRRREVECPEYCNCDVIKGYRRATCQNRKLVSVEIGMPPEVQILDLSYNQISELTNQIFFETGLTELKVLNLSHNKISHIHMFAFEGLSDLKSLDLSFNSIQYFVEQWFVSLKNLEELYLQGNNLKLINNQPRINLPLLKILDLKVCRIEHLHNDIFTGVPNLIALDISSNYFEVINIDVFLPLTKLKILFAEKNFLRCREKSVSMLRGYIRAHNITYFGPCRKLSSPNILPNLGKRKYQNVSPRPPQVLEKLIASKKLDQSTENEATTTKVGITEKVVLFDGVELLDKTYPEKIDKSDKSSKIKEAETLSDLSNFIESEKFQKMRSAERTKVLEDIPNYDDKTLNSDKIEVADKLKKVQDSQILDDLVNFVNSEISDQFKNVDGSLLSPKNSWLVDDDKEIDSSADKLGKKAFTEFDEKLKNLIKGSPTATVVVTTLTGTIVGIIIGATVPFKKLFGKVPNLPNLRKRSSKDGQDSEEFQTDDVNGKGGNGGRSSSKTKPKNRKKRAPDVPEKQSLLEGAANKLTDLLEPIKKPDQHCELSDYSDEEQRQERTSRSKPKPRESGNSRRRSRSSSSSPKRTRSPKDDQKLLLDNEHHTEDSTPVLGKKAYPVKGGRSAYPPFLDQPTGKPVHDKTADKDLD